MAGCASAAEDVQQQQEGAQVMVEGKTLLVLLLCACCQDPARVPSQPSRVRSVSERKLCSYSFNVLQGGLQSDFIARP